MFPLRDENPTLRTPIAVISIIGFNVAAWALIQGFGSGAALAQSLCDWGLIPGELLHTARPGTLVPLGEGLACRLEPTANSLSLISHMFLHGGWFHLIGNMWFLWVFGDNVEDAMGPWRFWMFYLLCGLACLFCGNLPFVNPWPMGIVFFVGETAGGFLLGRANGPEGDDA